MNFTKRLLDIRWCTVVTLLACALGGTSCVTRPPAAPTQMALRLGPIGNKAHTKVKVSLANRAVYVCEGEETKWAAAIAIGTPTDPTPVGNFKAFNKIANKRSNSYGFWVNGSDIRPGKRDGMPKGYKYVGYPMPYWVEFKSGYGFHAGAVWPQPRSHGCLRLHRTIAREFFEMVDAGTPIDIADCQPQDATVGKQVPRPTDYNHPDSPPSVLITEAPFIGTDVYF